MSKANTSTKTLTTLSASPLDRRILYGFQTSYGKPWGEVSEDEAWLMVSHADALEAAFPHEHRRRGEVQSIIDEGLTAKGLLFGCYDASEEAAEDDICNECRAAESGTHTNRDQGQD